jgi:hypothetical protein
MQMKKHFKMKIRTGDVTFITYLYAESEESARKAIMDYWKQNDTHAEIIKMEEV